MDPLETTTTEAFGANQHADMRMLSESISDSMTLAVIVFCCILICCLWRPSLVRSAVIAQQRRIENQARLRRTIPNGMSLDERRKFVSTILVTQKALVGVVEEGSAAFRNEQQKKSDLIIPAPSGDISDDDDDDEELGEEESLYTCAICLAPYKHQDNVCWSHNLECSHVFHRDCILEWLLRHEECPCCRHNFLTPHDTEEQEKQEQPVVPTTEGDQSSEQSDSATPVDTTQDTVEAPFGNTDTVVDTVVSEVVGEQGDADVNDPESGEAAPSNVVDCPNPSTIPDEQTAL